MGELPIYFARVLEEIHYSPGAWTGRRIGVFRREGVSENQVGEYERDYPLSFALSLPFASATAISRSTPPITRQRAYSSFLPAATLAAKNRTAPGSARWN